MTCRRSAGLAALAAACIAMPDAVAQAQPTAKQAAAAFKQAVAKLPGRVSLLVTLDGKVLAAATPDTPRAVGSAFKMQILRVLARQVAAGKLAWDTVIRLEDRDRSLGGLVARFPPRSAITVGTLAGLMISISDNSATDVLLRRVGRANVEADGPARNRPFISTREMFALKAAVNRPLHKRWLAADVAGRRKILQEVARLKFPRGGYAKYEFGWKIEWFYSARELCALIKSVHRSPYMVINPGLSHFRHWRRIAYKGGSEPGVLNFTQYAIRKDGRAVCVTATWNHSKPVKAALLARPMAILLHHLAISKAD